MLNINNLSVKYLTDKGQVSAVDNVSLKVSDGEFFGLAGPSGCGKSTLALAVLKLIEEPGKITSGKVEIDGTDILSLNEKQLLQVRGAKISMIFQDPFTSLNPVITVGEHISETLRCHFPSDKQKAKQLTIKLLERVKIPDPEKRYHEYPHQLSGGMRQRVGIAVAISCGAKLIIADEPTTALDVTTQAHIMQLLTELNREGLSVILITHNRRLIAKYCTRAALMDEGKIVFIGEAAECLKR